MNIWAGEVTHSQSLGNARASIINVNLAVQPLKELEAGVWIPLELKWLNRHNQEGEMVQSPATILTKGSVEWLQSHVSPGVQCGK